MLEIPLGIGTHLLLIPDWHREVGVLVILTRWHDDDLAGAAVKGSGQ